MVKIFVDGQEIHVEAGTILLKACLDNDIYIPNLCYMEGADAAPASCRLCFVDIEGFDRPVTSCTIRVEEGMVVSTDTPEVRRLQRSAFQLLMSVHDVDCGHCPANKKCELQRIARFLKAGLKPKGLERFLKEPEIYSDHSFIDYYPNRCVLCGRCINACGSRRGQSLLAFAARGFDTIISFYGEDEEASLTCRDCYACVEICPVGALVPREKEAP